MRSRLTKLGAGLAALAALAVGGSETGQPGNFVLWRCGNGRFCNEAAAARLAGV